MMDRKKNPALHLVGSGETNGAEHSLASELQERSRLLDKPHTFKKGQLVQWKAGLRNRRFPDSGEPAVVREVLPAPIYDPSENSSGGPLFQEPLTLVVGVIADGDFLEFRVDCRRFEPFH